MIGRHIVILLHPCAEAQLFIDTFVGFRVLFDVSVPLIVRLHNDNSDHFCFAKEQSSYSTAGLIAHRTVPRTKVQVFDSPPI